MYGLTDNIVAGPAGHIVAGPAGSFVAGPAGSFTPAPGAHVPVSGAGYIPYSGGGHVPYTEAGHVPITEAGHVPIDTSMATIPYSRAGGGMLYAEGSSMSAIPGASAHVPVSGIAGGGGGGGGGGAYSLGGSILGGGGGGGAGGGGLISGGGAGGGAGGGMNYVAHSGPGMGPVELRVGQALSHATANPPTTPGTEGFTVTPGGRTVPTPTGYVHPPRASHFHGHPMATVAHSPVRVDNNSVTTEAYQPYKPSYVWQGLPSGAPPPPFLASDYLKPSAYDPPRVVFSDEKPGPRPVVDDTIGTSGAQLTQVNNQTVNLDFAQRRDVEFTTNTFAPRNLTLDNSETRNVTLSEPVTRETNVTNDFSQTVSTDLSVHQQRTAQIIVEDAARVTNLFFLEGQVSPAAVGMGGPVMARVA